MSMQFKSTASVGVVQLAGVCSAGTVTPAFNIPPGKTLSSFTVYVEDTANQAVFSIHPYVEASQTTVGAVIAFGEPTATASLVTSKTIAATGTVDGAFMTAYSINQALGLHGVTSVFGFQMTVATTASGGTGTWRVSAAYKES